MTTLPRWATRNVCSVTAAKFRRAKCRESSRVIASCTVFLVGNITERVYTTTEDTRRRNIWYCCGPVLVRWTLCFENPTHAICFIGQVRENHLRADHQYIGPGITSWLCIFGDADRVSELSTDTKMLSVIQTIVIRAPTKGFRSAAISLAV